MDTPTPLSDGQRSGDALFAPIGEINTYLEETVRSMGLPTALTEAMLYSLLAPGKRLRPVLAWHSCCACGGRGEWSLAAAAALELIHCFSLVHDDLPALDNDDLRRGRPTLHKQSSEAMAILAGDAMMSVAFRLLTTLAPGGTARELIEELSTATTEMIAGQVYDTLGGLPPELSALDRLVTVHSKKTGALIRAACRMGAISAGNAGRSKAECEREIAAITEYAENIGLAFQIVDDLLDETQTTEHLGKTAGKDREQGKQTYPAVLGTETSRREVVVLKQAAVQALGVFGPAGAPLAELAAFVCDRTR